MNKLDSSEFLGNVLKINDFKDFMMVGFVPGFDGVEVIVDVVEDEGTSRIVVFAVRSKSK